MTTTDTLTREAERAELASDRAACAGAYEASRRHARRAIQLRRKAQAAARNER